MNRTPVRIRWVVSAFILPLTVWMVLGQEERPKNLKFFPKDIPRSELIAQMRNFSFALGVPCTHCHGTQEQTTPDLRGVDFSLDLKPTKQKAREMLRMLREINTKLLPKISHRSEFNLEVTCFTCHSGVPLPESIEARVLRQIKSEGIEAAIEDYRTTRQRYYGSAAYNFKEQPLVEVATQLYRQEDYQASVEISLLNLEFYPESNQSKYRLAEAYFQMGRTEEARKVYLELQEVRFYAQRAKARLEALGNPRH